MLCACDQVAFQDAQTACEWALDVQAALVHAEWPKPLYQLRYGEIIEDFGQFE